MRYLISAFRRAMRVLGIDIPVLFGSLRRVTPISRGFGLDRGRPIDRYYIDAFIERHRSDIKGRVLEAGGLVNYTEQFAVDQVTKGDVLYPRQGFEDATIVGDLATGTGIPCETFNCIIFTQVYQFIYELECAVRNTYNALKPGGVLLATVSGISQISSYDMEQWGDYWRFTDASVRRLFGEVFGPDAVQVQTYGNVLAACAFMHGLAVEELRTGELDHRDPDYQMLITVRAVKHK